MIHRSAALAGTALLAGLAAVACSRSDLSTSPTGTVASNAAAAQFNQMGDSIRAAGGSANDAAPFYGAAAVIGQAPNIQTVSIMIDDTATTMNAVAVAEEIFAGPKIACPVPAMAAGADAPFICPWGIPRVTRTLFAWTTTRPIKILTLVASEDSTSIGIPVPVFFPGTSTPGGMGTPMGTLADSDSSSHMAMIRPIPAHLTLFANHRTWWGTSGTQTDSVAPNGAPCRPAPTDSASAPRPGVMPSGRCQLANFTFAFSGSVIRPPIAIFGDSATMAAASTHTVSMSSAALTGFYLKLGSAALVGDGGGPGRH
ncbi:MAG TPA: hypothetical protein VN613_00160 [Gemmatimonadaceae bacterium]|nr:hypothetical protein [Gemmatimonadaceae bacterium]